MAIDPSGTVTSPAGFEAGATYAGMKTYGEGKLDLGIIRSATVCTAAAVFTKNRLYSASIDVNRAHLADRQAQAVVCNAGIANSSTGVRGVADSRSMCDLVGAKLGLRPADVLVCSTGVIGHYLPMDKVAAGIDAVELSGQGGKPFAQAIMTTDTRPKHGSVTFGEYVLGGCAKGSGMIHPNMATMLAFLTIDAPIDAGFLQEALSAAVEESFNLVSVDGDTSPSDSVIILSNGARGGERIGRSSALAPAFESALLELCTYLAKEIARDGEGATKLMEVRVSGAAGAAEARAMARLMTTSYLLKSAVHGADPNWGRIVSVIGRSGLHISEPGVTVGICGHRVFEHEQPTEFNEQRVAELMRADEVVIEVDLGVGEGEATAWGCDLSAEYVSINADYHT